MDYRTLADITVAVHVAWVAFVVFGLVFILVGRALDWKWVSNRWFRSVHLGMISVVIARALLWSECPLTTWERDLRILGGQVDAWGDVTYEGSAVGYVLHRLIHPVGVPQWVYPVVYVAFGLLILGTFWLAPVDWRRGQPSEKELAENPA